MIIYSKLPRDLKFTIGTSVVIIKKADDNPDSLVPGCSKNDIADELWEGVLKVYGKHVAIKRGFIFASKNDKEAKAQADEIKDEKTGLEKMDPDNVPGVQRNDDPDVKNAPAQQARK
ncbi:hypothetical protein ACIQVE_21385 [Pseudomonas sp. NPDC098747]|uniref:hypothetical protein n=1 Tax=Pseudomonas sp. NPDC098747 TaxID=3364487 RepID=UPI00383B56AE